MLKSNISVYGWFKMQLVLIYSSCQEFIFYSSFNFRRNQSDTIEAGMHEHLNYKEIHQEEWTRMDQMARFKGGLVRKDRSTEGQDGRLHLFVRKFHQQPL